MVELVGWGSENGSHNTIVNTYLKFDPEQLKYFFDFYYCRKRQDVANCARMSTDEFNLDTESLSSAITTVLEERVMLTSRNITDVPRSGIVDEDREDGGGSDDDDDPWSKDACPDGKTPLPPAQAGGFPALRDRRLPYGDDGSGEPR